MVTYAPRIGLWLVIPTLCLAYRGVIVHIVRWCRARGRMPVLSGLVYAFQVVGRGVDGSPGNRRFVYKILFGLLCWLFLAGPRKSFEFLLGAKVNTRQL